MSNILTMKDLTCKILSQVSNTRKNNDIIMENVKHIVKTQKDVIDNINNIKTNKVDEIATTAALPMYQTTGGVSRVERYQVYSVNGEDGLSSYKNNSIKNLFSIYESDEHIYDAKDDYMIYPLKEKIKDYIYSNKDKIEDIFTEIYQLILDEENMDQEELLVLCGTAVVAFLETLNISIPYTIGDSIIELFFIIYNNIMKSNNLINFIITHSFLSTLTDDDLSNKLVSLLPITLRYDDSVESKYANLNFIKAAILSIDNSILFEYIKMNSDKLYDYISDIIDNIKPSDMMFNIKGRDLKLIKKIFMRDENSYINFFKYLMSNKLDLLTRFEVGDVYDMLIKKLKDNKE